jgi:hypothetical protein
MLRDPQLSGGRVADVATDGRRGGGGGALRCGGGAREAAQHEHLPPREARRQLLHLRTKPARTT